MPIQIGMSCNPSWLCNGIEIFLAGLVIAALIGLVRIVHKERQANKEKKRRK